MADSRQSHKQSQKEVGYAASINDYLVWIDGLPNVKINEIVVNKDKARGLVTAVKNNQVEVLMLDDVKVEPQEMFERTFEQFTSSPGEHFLGRVINPLGIPIDGKNRFTLAGKAIETDKIPPGIKMRTQINRQFETGISLVDMLMPIAYGQRELIIGDPRSGKSSFLIDLVINQRRKNLICVIGLIGKAVIEIKRFTQVLEVNKAFGYSVVVAAPSSEKAPLIYLCPSVAVTIAEYFQAQGLDVLLILDDMGLHAKFYREISLLSGSAPGRESYPGDVFYQQAKLVERAGNFSKVNNSGSITALAVIETNLEDFSGYMPTNLMAMTDGHLLFDSLRYHQGHRPSIDVSLSVSRVGRQTQYLAQKQLADRIKALLAEANKLETFSRLGTDVSSATLQTIKQGRQIEMILKQSPFQNTPIVISMIVLSLIYTPLFLQKDVAFVQTNIQKIIDYLIKNINLESVQKQVATFRNDKELIDSVKRLVPALEKVCA